MPYKALPSSGPPTASLPSPGTASAREARPPSCFCSVRCRPAPAAQPGRDACLWRPPAALQAAQRLPPPPWRTPHPPWPCLGLPPSHSSGILPCPPPVLSFLYTPPFGFFTGGAGWDQRSAFCSVLGLGAAEMPNRAVLRRTHESSRWHFKQFRSGGRCITRNGFLLGQAALTEPCCLCENVLRNNSVLQFAKTPGGKETSLSQAVDSMGPRQ